MKTVMNLLIAFMLASCTGCGLAQSLYHNALACPRDFFESRREDKRNRAFAEQALRASAAGLPCGTCYSRDFADGFCDGFIDFMTNGGSGEPPPLPPQRYWSVRYQSPGGTHAAHEWFDGFRQGAASARAGGARQLVTVPTSDLAPPNVVMPPPTTHLGQPLPTMPMPTEVGPRLAPPVTPQSQLAPTTTPATLAKEPLVELPPAEPIKVGVPTILTPYEQLLLPPRYTTPPLPTQPPQPPVQRMGKPVPNT